MTDVITYGITHPIISIDNYKQESTIKNPFQNLFWQDMIKNLWVNAEKWVWYFVLWSAPKFSLKKDVKKWPPKKIPSHQHGAVRCRGGQIAIFVKKIHFFLLKLWFCNFHWIQPNDDTNHGIMGRRFPDNFLFFWPRLDV